ncbi:FadR family transcriptional regulator [Sinimarinibacterium sp. CAU 1509]|uniref:FadR/GntR family transcriptional regulator n=1 Tax=Sinimarinibacterium sp. CAU 1509 TaxID=2562283 RepID=UPI0010AC1361|nr:GntR family transcriptional regulator [Sinimarinibacterium sp. CAU 1509]TJY61042.1 FadR family transcriptional regulator [Sinimarinibacterium sp. CAU 1509]
MGVVMFQAINKRSVSDEVFDQLCNRIVSRELKAGDELPSERLLSEMLGVSRNAVREAIKRLQQARLVEVKHGGMTTVLDYRMEAGADLLPSLLFDRQGKIQVDVARGIVRMRQVLSPEIAGDAAVHGRDITADRLDAIVDGMVAAIAPAELQRLAFEFWDVLVDGSGNIAYRLAFNSLRKTYEPIWDLLTQMLGRDLRKLDTFRQLAALVRQGAREEAMHCAREYIDSSSNAIYQFLDLYERHAQQKIK